MIKLYSMMNHLAQRTKINIYYDNQVQDNNIYYVILNGCTVGKFILWQDKTYLILIGNICTIINNFNRQIFLQNTLILQCSLLLQTNTIISLNNASRKMILHVLLAMDELSIVNLENMLWDFLNMREMWCDYAKHSKQII